MKQIETQMNSLRLHGMAKSWVAIQESRQLSNLSLSDGMELLLQAETQERDQRRFTRLEHHASFRYKATMEEVKPDATRGLDKTLLHSLATGTYIKNGETILITGATGCGKSFLSSALGHQACMQGNKVAYYNTQKLLMKTKLTRVEGTSFKFFEKISKTDLLILDDFGLTHLDRQQQLDLMEIVEDRHAKKATIIASQLPVASWYDIIGEATIADAILDRLIHTSHRIEIKGESLRKKR
jgi:DNA replication protein DnaC